MEITVRRMLASAAVLLAHAAQPAVVHAFEAPGPQVFALEVEQSEAVRFERQATGRLVISPDGTPTDVTVEAGEPRIEAMYRRMIGTWRFVPILRDGVPVAKNVDMNLTLSADRIEGSAERMRFGIADVEFLDGTDPEDGDVELVTSDLKPPIFPTNMALAGVGASIMVLVGVDGTGRVTRAAVSDASLFARQTSSGRAAAAKVARFAKATLDVVDEWVIADPGVIDQGWALVPVHFAPPGSTAMDWTPVLPMTASPLDWMAEPLAAAKALSASGQAIDSDVRLLTPLAPHASN